MYPIVHGLPGHPAPNVVAQVAAAAGDQQAAAVEGEGWVAVTADAGQHAPAGSGHRIPALATS